MRYPVKKGLAFVATLVLCVTMLASSVAAQAPGQERLDPMRKGDGRVIFTIRYKGQISSVCGTTDMERDAVGRAATLLALNKAPDPRIAVCCSVNTMRLQTVPYDRHIPDGPGSCYLEYGNQVMCGYCGYVHSRTIEGTSWHFHF